MSNCIMMLNIKHFIKKKSFTIIVICLSSFSYLLRKRLLILNVSAFSVAVALSYNIKSWTHNSFTLQKSQYFINIFNIYKHFTFNLLNNSFVNGCPPFCSIVESTRLRSCWFCSNLLFSSLILLLKSSLRLPHKLSITYNDVQPQSWYNKIYSTRKSLNNNQI